MIFSSTEICKWASVRQWPMGARVPSRNFLTQTIRTRRIGRSRSNMLTSFGWASLRGGADDEEVSRRAAASARARRNSNGNKWRAAERETEQCAKCAPFLGHQWPALSRAPVECYDKNRCWRNNNSISTTTARVFQFINIFLRAVLFFFRGQINGNLPRQPATTSSDTKQPTWNVAI